MFHSKASIRPPAKNFKHEERRETERKIKFQSGQNSRKLPPPPRASSFAKATADRMADRPKSNPQSDDPAGAEKL